MAAKYQIPERMLTEVTQRASVILHQGAYVDTVICGQGYEAADSFCALCDGTRAITCPTCDGAEVVDDNDTECHNCKDGSVRCPQAAARWCHD
jgi:hypothetical protein